MVLSKSTWQNYGEVENLEQRDLTVRCITGYYDTDEIPRVLSVLSRFTVKSRDELFCDVQYAGT